MKVTLVGIKRVDYFSKKNNRQVLGWNLYVTHDTTDPQIEGLVAEDFYCKDDKTPMVNCLKTAIGEEIDVYFDRWGNVDEASAIA
jgi:hypothetical protein